MLNRIINQALWQLFSMQILKTAMMKKLLSFCLVLLTLSASAQTVTVTGVYDYTEAKAFVRTINKARMKKKLNTLKMDQGLTEAAMLRAAELSTQWSLFSMDEMTEKNTQRPNGKSFITLVQNKFNMPQGTECGEFFSCCVANPGIISIYRDDVAENKYALGSWRAVGAAVFYRNDQAFCVLIFSKHVNGSSEIPSGQWNSKVQVGTAKGKETVFLAKEPTTTFKFPKTVDFQVDFYYDYATEVVRLVNHVRDSAGLTPLVMDSALTELAMIRAAEMASSRCFELKQYNPTSIRGYGEQSIIGHTRPKGGSALTILTQEFEEASSKGENVASGHKTPQEVVNGWMNSPGHRANILHKSYKSIGVGFCCFNGHNYWTQLFTSLPRKGGYHPVHRAKATVQVSFDPAIESKIVSKVN